MPEARRKYGSFVLLWFVVDARNSDGSKVRYVAMLVWGLFQFAKRIQNRPKRNHFCFLSIFSAIALFGSGYGTCQYGMDLVSLVVAGIEAIVFLYYMMFCIVFDICSCSL